MRGTKTAGVAAAVGLALGLVTIEAEELESLGGAHWSASAQTTTPSRRTLLIVDRTGDERAHAALESFASRWNVMSAASAGAPLPAVQIAAGRAADACVLPLAGEQPGDVIVCRDETLASAGVGGPLRVDARKQTQLAIVKLKTATLRWSECGLRTAVAHEMGHVMGLAHNDRHVAGEQPSIMMSGAQPYRHGCGIWFNAHDRRVLDHLYRVDAPVASGEAPAAGAP